MLPSNNRLALIRDSFDRVAPMHEMAARSFYDRLLAIAPEVRPLLRHEIGGQGRMFMATLAMLVRGVRDVPALLFVAAIMAERYVTFGASPERLPLLGEALLETLANALGDDFTAETRAAWSDAYAALSDAIFANIPPAGFA
jgi:hemoglobin-like flavoprotein